MNTHPIQFPIPYRRVGRAQHFWAWLDARMYRTLRLLFDDAQEAWGRGYTEGYRQGVEAATVTLIDRLREEVRR
jgi:hypothetical protein